jgi:hypothetical protein
MMGKHRSATKIWTSPIPPEKGRNRETQNLCDRCFEYEEKRNGFILRAEKHAYERNGTTYHEDKAKREEWAKNWNRDFHGKMNELMAAV